jgi:hypothetical protein
MKPVQTESPRFSVRNKQEFGKINKDFIH